MRKLIEITQETLIQCDNPLCDYVIKNETKDINADISMYINKPCPKCGENLLTEEDYHTSKKLLKYVNFMNKWFSWTTIFSRSKENSKVEMHVHDGIKIKHKDK